jgi:hypothetical protein
VEKYTIYLQPFAECAEGCIKNCDVLVTTTGKEYSDAELVK